ncbi:MAG: response regulator transcription factor [Chloroflexota bacterium]|nr:MAG: response regulator transcription factor [Chloroflexota bacterium]
MTTPIRVAIVDDHPVVRQGVKNVLAYHADIEIVGEAENAAGLFRDLNEFCPDLILLDIRLPGASGIEITRRLKRQYNWIKIIILTTYDDDQFLSEAIQAGAEGYLLKSASPAVLAAAIRRVAEGERLISPSLMDTMLREFQQLSQGQEEFRAGLTDQELEILAMIADGATNREIAGAMFISEVTAKRKVQEIMEKLGASNRAQAAAEAARRGLV